MLASGSFIISKRVLKLGGILVAAYGGSAAAIISMCLGFVGGNKEPCDKNLKYGLTDRSVIALCLTMPTLETPKSKRDELLEIASRLFYEQGYHRTGVKQIIDEAGIAKGTFYSHFKSKEDLAVAWLKLRHTSWNSMMDQYLAERNSNDPAGLIFSRLGCLAPIIGVAPF
jgi:hypothetical protein